MTQAREGRHMQNRAPGIDLATTPMPPLPARRTSDRADLADLDWLLGTRSMPMTVPPRIGAPAQGLPVLGEAPGTDVLQK
jgi:hypothetical protein